MRARLCRFKKVARHLHKLRSQHVHGKRVGWLGNLNGYLPMESGILEVCQSALKVLETTGCR
jgi:Asp-tRNA(Asn)/Glu-tRNA(Gln) amidotransferase A subunit family amidase